ncbi:MAG: hypothetical protein PHW02_07445 [bacterium]|nr:hypothetical protein [bacterium]
MKKSVFLIAVVFLLSSCSQNNYDFDIAREDKLPTDIEKVFPENDIFPPVMNSDLWESPVPMVGPVNTLGAEDSPFITKDMNRFFFFFTPDVRIPLTEQLIDTVTGIWMCDRSGLSWTEPRRVYLESIECLDGCAYVTGDTLYFASVRAGNIGEIDIFTAVRSGEEYVDVTNCGDGLNVTYDIGEFHISEDKKTLYYGNYNGTDYDLYYLTYGSDGWENPTEIIELNTEKTEFQPCLTYDGNELWYTSDSKLGYAGPAVFRSVKTGDAWGEPEEIISNFAGEPCVDNDGNIYFVHHYMDSSMNIIEADIYFCKKK